MRQKATLSEKNRSCLYYICGLNIGEGNGRKEEVMKKEKAEGSHGFAPKRKKNSKRKDEKKQKEKS